MRISRQLKPVHIHCSEKHQLEWRSFWMAKLSQGIQGGRTSKTAGRVITSQTTGSASVRLSMFACPGPNKKMHCALRNSGTERKRRNLNMDARHNKFACSAQNHLSSQKPALSSLLGFIQNASSLHSHEFTHFLSLFKVLFRNVGVASIGCVVFAIGWEALGDAHT